MPRKLLASIMVMLTSATAMTGCVTEPSQDPGLTPEEVQALVRMQEEQDPFLRSQKSFGLEAEWADAETVQVSLENKTAQAVEIGPAMFGLLTPPEREPVRVLPQTANTFPSTRLEPGATAAGTLVFPEVARQADMRLVFYHPDMGAAMAPIE